MLYDLPKSEFWQSHLKARFQMARELRMVASATTIVADSGRIFVPDDVDPSVLGAALPHDSIRTLRRQPAPGNQWLERADTFLDVASWLLKRYRDSGNATLFCEAGFRKVGDPPLADLSQISHQDRLFFTADLSNAGPELVCKTLRLSRSNRVLAVVTSRGAEVEANRGEFICDAFDLDSLIIASFATEV